MFSLTKRVMAIYMPLLAKMAKDSPLIVFTKVNFDLLCDVTFSYFFLFVVHVGIIRALIEFA